MRFAEVTLAGTAGLADFYRDVLELPLDGDAIRIGETLLRFEPGDGCAFYHFALLVPGDRFAAAHTWARERVELLGDVFASEDWDSRAVYFHDPAGNILELIAHHGREDSGREVGFAGEELVGLSELGIVGDKRELLRRLDALGLEMWDGTLEAPELLAFVGEKARTLILSSPGRGWMPLGRPAEPHPVAVLIETPRSVRFEL